MTELLDWKAVWNDTYRRLALPAKSGAVVTVFTALHGYEHGITLCADVEITIGRIGAEAKFKLQMTPEEMEQLAEQLFQSAEWQRDLIKRLEAHNAAAQVIAEGETRQPEAA